jgi:hypothetical protein
MTRPTASHRARFLLKEFNNEISSAISYENGKHLSLATFFPPFVIICFLELYQPYLSCTPDTLRHFAPEKMGGTGKNRNFGILCLNKVMRDVKICGLFLGGQMAHSLGEYHQAIKWLVK